MPKLPTDLHAAKFRADKDRDARAANERKRIEAAANDRAIIREFANELRAKQGLPPLGPDEPVTGFFCTRGAKR